MLKNFFAKLLNLAVFIFAISMQLENICNLYAVRKYLDQQSIKVLVHVFVSSRLEFCSCLLVDFPNYMLQKKFSL